MNRKRKDIAEKWKRLAEQILESEGSSDIESLKEQHMSIYDDLVRLSIQENESESSVQVPESSQEQPKPGLDSPESMSVQPEPMSEEDEIIPRAEETKRTEQKETVKKPVSEEQEYPTLSDLFVPTFNEIKEDMSQKEEFKDTVSLDETEKLFETRKEEIRQLSLNDRLVSSSIQIGLNDRIAFVNKLFNFSQSDFNKVLSRLNACTSKDEALHYVQYQVKANYNWKGKEDLEERFISLIERKFMA